MPKTEMEITIRVIVDYDVHGAIRGHRDSMGVPTEPDEPANVEINSIEKCGKPISLSKEEFQDVHQELTDSVLDSYL